MKKCCFTSTGSLKEKSKKLGPSKSSFKKVKNFTFAPRFLEGRPKKGSAKDA